jgi:hypothetical protein
MAKKQPTHEQLLATVRARGDADDLTGWEETVAELAGRGDEKAARYILTIKPYNDVDDLDEMWQVIHSVEAFPRNIYIKALVSELGNLCRSSEMLALHLVRRITGSDEYTDRFILELAALSPDDRGCVRALLGQSPGSWGTPNQNRDRIAAVVKGRAPRSR